MIRFWIILETKLPHGSQTLRSKNLWKKQHSFALGKKNAFLLFLYCITDRTKHHRFSKVAMLTVRFWLKYFFGIVANIWLQWWTGLFCVLVAPTACLPDLAENGDCLWACKPQFLGKIARTLTRKDCYIAIVNCNKKCFIPFSINHSSKCTHSEDLSHSLRLQICRDFSSFSFCLLPRTLFRMQICAQ